MTLSIFTPKIEKSISVNTEGITNLGESLTLTFLYLEVRFKIVLHTAESVKRADLNYVILICFVHHFPLLNVHSMIFRYLAWFIA